MSTLNETNTEDDEQAMACGLRRGDRAVVADFYNRHAAYLAGVCSRYITNTDDAEDVFHDAMLKIVQKASSFEYRGPGSLRSWAARITANEAVTFLRKNNWGLTDIDNLPDTPDEPEPDVSDITPETIHDKVANRIFFPRFASRILGQSTHYAAASRNLSDLIQGDAIIFGSKPAK